MASTPYPLPRQTRESSILVGNGTAGPYGPTAFKVFDTADVSVVARAAGQNVFTEVAGVTITKTSGLAFDTVSVTFSATVPASTSFVIQARRTHERSLAVTRGGALDSDQLEKELSKQATVISEARRDLARAVSVSPGDAPIHVKAGFAGEMPQFDAGGNIVSSGQTVGHFEDMTAQTTQARDQAVAAKDTATSAAGTATAAAGTATTKAGEASASAGAAAADKATVAGWKDMIEGWKDQVAQDRADVQDDKVVAGLAADAAAASATDAQEILDEVLAYNGFDSIFLGDRAANPTGWNPANPTDPAGVDALVRGLKYYNTTAGEYRTYSGSAWASGAGNTSDFARISQNGADFNAATFRTNLDIYSKGQVDTFAVKLTGNQTINGVKTFSSAPVVPDGSFAPAKLDNGAAVSILGRAANSAGARADIAAAANDRLLARVGDVLDFVQLTVGMITDGIISYAKLAAAAIASATELRAGTASKLVDAATVHSSMAWVQIIASATPAIDHAAGFNCYIILTSNTTFGAPSNAKPGMPLNIEITPGAFAPSWHGNYKFGSAGAPSITSKTIAHFICRDASTFVFLGTSEPT